MTAELGIGSSMRTSIRIEEELKEADLDLQRARAQKEFAENALDEAEDDIDQLTIQIDALEGELRHLFDEPTP